MSKKPTLTVVPFKSQDTEDRDRRIERIKEIIAHPELKAAFCVTIDKDGNASMQCTSEDHMVLSYMVKSADLIVSGILLGEETDDGEIELVGEDEE